MKGKPQMNLLIYNRPRTLECIFSVNLVKLYPGKNWWYNEQNFIIIRALIASIHPRSLICHLQNRILVEIMNDTLWALFWKIPTCECICHHGSANEIPAELFISLKDDAIKVLHSSWQQTSANLEDPAMATGLKKVNPYPYSQGGWYQRIC